MAFVTGILYCICCACQLEVFAGASVSRADAIHPTENWHSDDLAECSVR